MCLPGILPSSSCAPIKPLSCQHCSSCNIQRKSCRVSCWSSGIPPQEDGNSLHNSRAPSACYERCMASHYEILALEHVLCQYFGYTSKCHSVLQLGTSASSLSAPHCAIHATTPFVSGSFVRCLCTGRGRSSQMHQHGSLGPCTTCEFHSRDT